MSDQPVLKAETNLKVWEEEGDSFIEIPEEAVKALNLQEDERLVVSINDDGTALIYRND